MPITSYDNCRIKPKKGSKVIETDIVSLWLEDTILHLITKKKVRTVSNINAALDAIEEITKGKKMRLLSETNDLRPYDASVPKDLLFKKLRRCFKAIAIVSCSPLGKMIPHIYLLKKPPCPTKFFDNPEAAREWLDQYK